MRKFKCKFKNEYNKVTISVYKDVVSIDPDSGYSYNPVTLTQTDIKKINKCINK